MSTSSLQEFVAKIATRNRITFADVRRLQRDILPDGIVDREQAELLLGIDRRVARADIAWADWLVVTIVDFVVWGERPTGTVEGGLRSGSATCSRAAACRPGPGAASRARFGAKRRPSMSPLLPLPPTTWSSRARPSRGPDGGLNPAFMLPIRGANAAVSPCAPAHRLTRIDGRQASAQPRERTMQHDVGSAQPLSFGGGSFGLSAVGHRVDGHHGHARFAGGMRWIADEAA